MHLPPLTPEQAVLFRDSMARTADLFRQLVDAIRECVRRAAPAMRAITAYVEALQSGRPAADPLGLAYKAAAGTRPRMTAQARPAWVSPYGPAPRRH
ncbi:hypothetical protein ACKI16_29685 [Streptomyces scabiei]|uniref:hypothetical protein n=1 Tax=Streptomyces scabiei TaxID=1930 RepID=UPI0038F78B9A